jgi:hypothetical protein
MEEEEGRGVVVRRPTEARKEVEDEVEVFAERWMGGGSE